MHKYRINIFWSEEDECFIAEVPDLKGYSAVGDTPEEALKEVRVAMKNWLEVARERKLILEPKREAA
jgi:predicted RNase H-like HicB family nuclease